MKKHLVYWLAAVLVVGFGCQKELSFEGSNEPAKGSLQSDITGDCLPKTVNGNSGPDSGRLRACMGRRRTLESKLVSLSRHPLAHGTCAMRHSFQGTGCSFNSETIRSAFSIRNGDVSRS